MSGMVPPCMRQVWSRNVITCTHDVGRGVWVALAHMPGVDEAHACRERTLRVVRRSTRRIRRKRRTWAWACKMGVSIGMGVGVEQGVAMGCAVGEHLRGVRAGPACERARAPGSGPGSWPTTVPAPWPKGGRGRTLSMRSRCALPISSIWSMMLHT